MGIKTVKIAALGALTFGAGSALASDNTITFDSSIGKVSKEAQDENLRINMASDEGQSFAYEPIDPINPRRTKMQWRFSEDPIVDEKLSAVLNDKAVS